MATGVLVLVTAMTGAHMAAAAGSAPARCTKLDAGSQTLKIEAWGANAIRVRAVPAGGAFRDDLVSALPLPDRRPQGGCQNHRLLFDGPSTTVSGNLKAGVGSDGRLAFTRVSDGKVMLAERTVRALAPTTTTPAFPGFLSLELDFEAVPGERIYGLGQHKTGQLDNKGLQAIDLAPRNTEVFIPVYHSSVGYAFLLNLPSFGTVVFNDTSSAWHVDTVVQADFWVATTADSPPHATSPWSQLQSAYADATGHAPVYPEWASGFWQCKNRYHNQSQVLGVANGYIERGYPLSLMIIDYYSWAPDPLGDESMPKQCWPDPKAMVDQLKDAGVELMISPYFHQVAEQSKYYEGALESHLLALDDTGKPATAYDGAYVYDLFQKEARDYAFNAVQKGYIEPFGLHHYWLDCDEPCGGDPATSVYNNGTWPASFVGAAFPHKLNQMVYENMGAPGAAYQHDNVMLARSGWAGSQRYGTAVWSGDTSSTWNDLGVQFRAGLNMVMSGIPYWTTDIGGYNGGNISSPDFRQLVVRWFQWGAFCPLFRNHGRRGGGPHQDNGGPCGRTGGANEIWEFGNESEAAIARVMAIREQLRPYVMEQYGLASSQGTPVMRPLFFDFWEDDAAQGVDDQLMFGPKFLLAPQLLANTSSRVVYLPRLPVGEVWRNFFSGVSFNTSAGGVNITEETPFSGAGFGTFPLFQRVTVSPYPAPSVPPTPPTPPTPPLPMCSDDCNITASTERATGGRLYTHVNSSSTADCCALCKADPKCYAFVWGKENYSTGAESCFMLGSPVTSVRHANGRSYGCVRP